MSTEGAGAHLPTIDKRVEMLETVIFGDPRINAIGLMKRVSDLEELIKRWQRMELMLKGALAIMALTSLVNVVAVAKTVGLIP